MSSAVTLKRSTPLVVWLLAGLAFVAAWTKPVQGAVVTFTNEPDWTAAIGLGTITVEDFSGNPAGFTQIPVNTQFNVGAFDVFYTTAGNVNEPTNRLVNSGGVQRLDLQGDKDLGAGDPAPDQNNTTITFNFSTEIVGFAADFGTLTGPGGAPNFDFTLQNGNLLSIDIGSAIIDIDSLLTDVSGITGIPDQEIGFVGFVSDTPFDSLTITLNPVFAVDSFSLDNVRLGGPPVPEPSTLLVACTFGTGFLLRRRRRRKSVARSLSE